MRTPTVAVLIVLSALTVVGCQGAASSLTAPHPASETATDGAAADLRLEQPPHAEGTVTLGQDDGVVPEPVTVFAATPAVSRLDPDLLRALRRAARDAARQGIVFYVDSGWRSRRYQEQLLRQALVKYGSRARAARWVASPDTSAHVSGDAIDIGAQRARQWLSEHGSTYALCQTYRNEPWHYELRPRAIATGCPQPYADPTHDPRMRQ